MGRQQLGPTSSTKTPQSPMDPPGGLYIRGGWGRGGGARPQGLMGRGWGLTGVFRRQGVRNIPLFLEWLIAGVGWLLEG